MTDQVHLYKKKERMEAKTREKIQSNDSLITRLKGVKVEKLTTRRIYRNNF